MTISTESASHREPASSSSSPASATTRLPPARSRMRAPGDVILFEDSYRNMSVAISNGNAAAMLHAVVGRPLSIRVA